MSDLLARELVPGDVVELHTGDRVPADLRLLSLNTATLRAEQASLTGEAVAVQKVRRGHTCSLRTVRWSSFTAHTVLQTLRAALLSTEATRDGEHSWLGRLVGYVRSACLEGI